METFGQVFLLGVPGLVHSGFCIFPVYTRTQTVDSLFALVATTSLIAPTKIFLSNISLCRAPFSQASWPLSGHTDWMFVWSLLFLVYSLTDSLSLLSPNPVSNSRNLGKRTCRSQGRWQAAGRNPDLSASGACEVVFSKSQ